MDSMFYYEGGIYKETKFSRGVSIYNFHILIMDIKTRVAEIKTLEDLLSLINDLKSEELGDRAYPIAMRQINFHCNPNRLRNRYILYKIPKKVGGFRTICAPNKGLKEIQIWLNKIFSAIYTPSPFAMGFATGRSVAMNAGLHTGKNYVYNIDLKDFFPSIQQARIWKRLLLTPFNFPQSVANVLAGLCCMKDISDRDNPRYILPQGAPTSPLLTNAICDTLDRRLAGLAKRFGLDYSRYADDITFSSMHNVYAQDGEFVLELKRIISGQGFTINESKTRLQKKGESQEVTGLVVNEKANVTRKYVRELRDLMYIWSKYGYTTAYQKFYPRYKRDKGHVKKGEPNLENVLNGKLLYLRMVKGESDSVYQRLYQRFIKLTTKKEASSIVFADSDIKFIESMSLSEFENKLQTTIDVSEFEPSKKRVWFQRDGRRVWIKVSNSIDSIDRVKTIISLCEKNGKHFYLIHFPISESTMAKRSSSLKNRTDECLEKLFESGFDLNTLISNGN